MKRRSVAQVLTVGLLAFGLGVASRSALVAGSPSASFEWISNDGGSGGESLFGMSADGRSVLYWHGDLIVLNRETGVRQTVMSGPFPEGSGNGTAAISRSGRFVAFLSDAVGLVPAPPRSGTNLYVRDLQTDTVRALAATSQPPSGIARVMDDGSVVAGSQRFALDGSTADLPVNPTCGFNSDFTRICTDAGLYDVVSGTTTPFSFTHPVEEIGAYPVAMSGDASKVVFVSAWRPPDPCNGAPPGFPSSFCHTGTRTVSHRYYVYDVATSVSTLVSVDPGGQPIIGRMGARNLSGLSGAPTNVELSDDGNVVYFALGTDCVPGICTQGSWNLGVQLFRRDVAAGITYRVTTIPGDTGRGSVVFNYAASADGSTVAFVSDGAFASVADPVTGPHVYARSGPWTVSDWAPPIIRAVPARAWDVQKNFWLYFTAPVSLGWEVYDPDSPAIAAPPALTLTDTNSAIPAIATSAQVCDTAGNCSTGSFAYRVDSLAPTVVAPPTLSNGGVLNASGVFAPGDQVVAQILVSDTGSGVGLKGTLPAPPAYSEFWVDVDPGIGRATPAAGGNVPGKSFVQASLPASVTSALTPGVHAIGFRVRDAVGNTTPVSVQFTISGAFGLQVTTANLDGGRVGAAYGSLSLAASGGAGSYSWSASGLPLGLSVSAAGVLSGVPAEYGAFTPTFTVTDGSGVSASATLALQIDPTAVATFPSSGGTVATGAAPSASDPLVTSVATPVSGSIAIYESPLAPTANVPSNYVAAGTYVTIDAKGADGTPLVTPASAPLQFTFSVAKAQLDAVGATPTTLSVFRDGALIVDCVNPTVVAASPDPCVASRAATGVGDAVITVYSTHASTWTFGRDSVSPTVGALSASVNPKGATQSSSLTLPATDAQTGVAGGEYWIGADPGFGNGTPMTKTTTGLSATVGTSLTPGVYSVGARARDAGGNWSTTASTVLVVYDASAGFVTGAGWIDSPAGAYRPDPSVTGKATFGFEAKYRKGATVPDGNTQFVFQNAKLRFQSTSFAWLVVAGARAQFKGTGTVNGADGYDFLLTAVDGQLNGGGGTDKFRIKIWNRSTGQVVYDNNLGADDNTNPTTTITGNIIIHS